MRRLAVIVVALIWAFAAPVAAEDRSDEEAFEAFMEFGSGNQEAGSEALAGLSDPSAENIAEAKAYLGGFITELEGLDVRPCFEEAYEVTWVGTWLAYQAIELLEDGKLAEAMALVGAMDPLGPIGAERVSEARVDCVGVVQE